MSQAPIIPEDKRDVDYKKPTNDTLNMGDIGLIWNKLRCFVTARTINILVPQFFIINYIIVKYFIAMDTSVDDIWTLNYLIFTITTHREN